MKRMPPGMIVVIVPLAASLAFPVLYLSFGKDFCHETNRRFLLLSLLLSACKQGMTASDREKLEAKLMTTMGDYLQKTMAGRA